MHLDIVWNQVTTQVDLVDGQATVGGGESDDICIEGLPAGLLTLRLEGNKLGVNAQHSVRVGHAVFPARVPRLLIEGEELRLPNDVVLRRVVDEKKRQSRRQMATAFVAHELLSGELSAEDTRAATFTCVTGLDQGRVFPIPFDENMIGRADDAAIRIRDRAVSRHHVRVVRQGREYLLKVVTSSMNGAYVNGLLLKRATALKTGDVVEVGQTILRFDASERAPEERTVVADQAQLLVPSAVRVPQAAEAPPQLQHLEPHFRLEMVLMSTGLVLTLLGVAAVAMMLR